MATFRTSQPGSAADPSHPHLILVGLPGSGKSTVAAMLARRLGRTFLDFDAEITRREGLTIAEIFAQRGEPAFRQLEHALTQEVALFGGMVLAPGGGWVGQPEAVALLRPASRMVYLKISPAGAIRRMGRNVAGRPLLSRPDPRGELERLLASRRSVYESADLVVDVEHLDSQRVADEIQRQLSL
jgi:shikimate kinase